MTLAERVAQWPEQWRQEGVAQGRREGVAQGRREGVAQGRREGVAEERALVGRIAAVRFGDAVGRQVEHMLGDTDEWHRLTAVAELVVRAGSGPELVQEVARRLGQSGQKRP